MKTLRLLFLFLFVSLAATAQKVSVDKKTNIVTVEGEPSFVLKPKNKILWQSDYALENLDGQELAYFKAEKREKWNNTTHNYDNELFYGITFSQSGNYCELRNFTSLSIVKALAKEIAAARLVQGNAISPEAEQKFVVMHNGVFLKDPNKQQPAVVVNVGGSAAGAPAAASAPASISISGEKIYNHDELTGTFRKSSENGYTTISIYNRDDNKVAIARHKDKSDEDWEIMPEGGSKISLRFYTDQSLERLFKYLAEKGYL